MKKGFGKLITMLVCITMSLSFVLSGCTIVPNDGENPGGETPHEHTYSEEWTYDGENHWHAATCEHTDLKKDVAPHSYGEDDTCVCGSTKGHEHTYSEEWTYDGENHWHAANCEHTDLKKDVAPHAYGEDGSCVCGSIKPVTPPEDEEFAVTYREGYTPQRFADVTYKITELAPGVHLVANSMTLKSGSMNGNTSVVYTIEIDLRKANVVAGTKGNKTYDFNWDKETPYQTALDWEAATGGRVYASVNADFFNSRCVNAFVKDGVILQSGHQDNGNYDYKNSASDVPASAPMLFGVKGTTAQVAPIITVDGDPTSPAVKQQLIKAKLSYALSVNGEFVSVQENAAASADYISYLNTGMVSQKGGYAVKVDTTKGATNMEVLEVKSISASKTERLTAGFGYAWLHTTAKDGAIANYMESLKVGDTVSFSVASPDGAWNGYETVLGCRQALVIGDEIASTVTLENTNGAQAQDIPRTAVGIKNGKVVLFVVESMFYYKKNQPGDTHGMNLPELAEFAYFYGCSDAANFDGGGSTHLVVHPEGEDARVVVRSADYEATTNLFRTRIVMNTFLITSRKGS